MTDNRQATETALLQHDLAGYKRYADPIIQEQQDRIKELETLLRDNMDTLEAMEIAIRTASQRREEIEEGARLLIQVNNNHLDKMKGLQDDIKNLMEADNRGMTLYDMGQLVCGELPEGWEMTIEIEKGYGEAILHKPDGRKIDGSELAESSVEDQIIELVKLAKGEPSEYDLEEA